jgi:aryl-alcohol dehydrogenase-like predicted oxidoreductase
LDEATDRGYRDAVVAALRSGINFIDTSLNYRHQRSEICIGAAVEALAASREVARDEIVVCTKAGYLVPGAIPSGIWRATEAVGDMHSMAIPFLADQLERSRKNLRLETIDVFYLHNPETQLSYVSVDEFYQRLRAAFDFLEQQAARGAIRYYGTATWDGYRRPAEAADRMSLARLVEIAQQTGGLNHHFRFIQLPFNLAMAEAFLERPERVNGAPLSILEAAAQNGITVVGSATLLQARLARGLPAELAARLPGTTDAQRAIQFARSAPGMTVSLVGMSKPVHVAENITVAQFPPLAPEEYQRLYRTA